jgi:hypothetical protein
MAAQQAGDAMTTKAGQPTAQARADGDPDELVAWCAATPDLVSFRQTLRRISSERWPGVQAGLAAALGGAEPSGVASAGNVADRARRARSAARSLKLQMVEQEAGARLARDPDARALRKLARLGS